jgi:hypothetical protein
VLVWFIMYYVGCLNTSIHSIILLANCSNLLSDNWLMMGRRPLVEFVSFSTIDTKQNEIDFCNSYSVLLNEVVTHWTSVIILEVWFTKHQNIFSWMTTLQWPLHIAIVHFRVFSAYQSHIFCGRVFHLDFYLLKSILQIHSLLLLQLSALCAWL